MARVTLAPFIQSISGKVGDLQFRTLKSGRTVVHTRKTNLSACRREPTEKERAQRRRFGTISSVVAVVQNSYPRIDRAAADRKRIWQKVSYIYAKYADTITDDAELQAKLIEEFNFSATKTGF